jgi:putative ABC transport system substrate-binding protein
MPVVGYLYPGSPEANANNTAAFRKGLNEAGFVEGRNVAVEYRFAHNEPTRLPELAADLVRRRVAVIAAPGGTIGARTAQALTTSIPIVFSAGVDAVQAGLVASINRPGGNVTGISSMNAELGAKRLGLLHELLPKAARYAVLLSPNRTLGGSALAELQVAASSIGRQIEAFYPSTNREIDDAFANSVQQQADAVLISPNALMDNRRVQIVALAAHYRLPAIYAFREHVEVGGLMSYGSSATDRDRQAGIYTGRILKGEKPADLPVMQPTKFEFVLNLHTAKLLGLNVPPGLLAIADEVIE